MKLLSLLGRKKNDEPSKGLVIVTEKDRDVFRTEEQKDAAYYFSAENKEPVVKGGCFPKKDKYTCGDVTASWKNGCLVVIMAPVYFILNIGRIIAASIKALGKFFGFIAACFTEPRIPEVLMVLGCLIFILGLILLAAAEKLAVPGKAGVVIGLVLLLAGLIKKLFSKEKRKWISDEEYDELVKKILSIEDVKAKALEAHGLDETEVNEIEPIHFGGPLYDGGKFRIGKDGYIRTNKWQDTWIFFSKTTLFGIQYDLNTDSGDREVRTYEYQYEDITSVFEDNKTEQVLERKTKEEKKAENKKGGCLKFLIWNPKIPSGCKKDAELKGCLADDWEPGCFGGKKKPENSRFKLVTKKDSKLRIIVPGDALEISYKNNNDENNSIKAMKAMLRDKKNNK